ncbi:hypothetical protein PF001_g8221 [Phytophthora fragariae]|uniref:Uncharacterized protein n=1 Tax=Phytophthora fragariae TaxID=53985 RepID=A0A6A4E7D6_9STRA|nr:hypothetical protein PF001_g8221 [Phytophthora fragariae]KAE9346048.1 hypothetical protein PF008_g8473 [Phytophthora fragariae]
MRPDAAFDAQDARDAAFNPLVALQSLLAADVASAKQRVRAAQQLQSYFARLSPTPGLLLSYEPYLPLLTEILGTKGQELQAAVLAVLLALAGHNPAGFSDWMARNTQLGSEPWLVQWSYALLLQTEKTVPRRGDADEWDKASTQFKEFDRAFARVLHMWRTLLDHTADVALVDQLVKYLQALLVQQEEGADKWRKMMLKKLQTHFVDIADVLIGWMMSTGPHSPLREEILPLLHHFGRLWADNSVFSLQLLNSFADEIVNFAFQIWLYPRKKVPIAHSLECSIVWHLVPSQSILFSAWPIVPSICSNARLLENTRPVQAAAVRILEGEIPARIVRKGGQPKRLKILECLFHARCGNGATHITQLCLHLLRLGGISALKTLGTRAFQRLNGRHGGKGNNYFVFAASCFVLASRDSEILMFTSDDDVTHAVGILELITAKLEKQSHRNRQHRLTPRQVCLVLKMASTFVDVTERNGLRTVPLPQPRYDDELLQ